MDKVDKLIQTVRLLREEGAIANVVGTGGLTGSATPPGRMDGYDKVTAFTRRKTPQIIGKGTYPGARTRWKGGLQ
ncbi:hypothetical protein EBR43_13890 [bacterium]|nr:hypothetical protein [bacterium]